MIRKAFVMSVHAGQEAEYEQRHRPIWLELEQMLKAHGVYNYSIFLHPQTRQLFGYAEIEDEERWAAIAQTPVCRKWWTHMQDLMPANPDHSPQSLALREVFHIAISTSLTSENRRGRQVLSDARQTIREWARDEP